MFKPVQEVQHDPSVINAKTQCVELNLPKSKGGEILYWVVCGLTNFIEPPI